MRRLVITADDLGRDPETTEVVLDLLARGAVTATTLVPVAPYAAEAARSMHGLGVVPRVHLTLTSERGLPPWRPLSGRVGLAERDGTFSADPNALGRRGWSEDVRAELDAQLAWARGHGLAPVGADSHGGMLYGLHGGQKRDWVRETLVWCAAHGLAFRLPRHLGPFAGRLSALLVLRAHRRAVTLADELGVPIPETMITNTADVATLGSYEALREDLVARLDRLPEGVSELFLHPSTETAAEDGPVRAWEARLLVDPVWRRAVDRSGLTLTGGWWS